jgi:hypothetical protein
VISLITITAREHPGLEAMAVSIFNALNVAIPLIETDVRQREAPPVRFARTFEWIIVDKLRDTTGRREQVQAWTKGLPVIHIAPKPTDREPDMNGARNSGLICARGDYVLFLDDWSIVSEAWFRVAWEARLKGWAVRYPFAYVYDDAQPVTVQMPVWPYPINPTGMRGSAVGYPMEPLLQLNGFDEAYAGEIKEDIEIGVRMARLGVQLMAVPGAWVVEKKNGQVPIFRVGCQRNDIDMLLQQLIRDRDRTQPYGNPYNLRELRLAARGTG